VEKYLVHSTTGNSNKWQAIYTGLSLSRRKKYSEKIYYTVQCSAGAKWKNATDNLPLILQFPAPLMQFTALHGRSFINLVLYNSWENKPDKPETAIEVCWNKEPCLTNQLWLTFGHRT